MRYRILLLIAVTVALALSACGPGEIVTIEPAEEPVEAPVQEEVPAEEPAEAPAREEVPAEPAEGAPAERVFPGEPAAPSDLHWSLPDDTSRDLNQAQLIYGKEVVIVSKVDCAWEGEEVTFKIYHEETGFFSFLDPDNLVRDLSGTVDENCQVVTAVMEARWADTDEPGRYYPRQLVYTYPDGSKKEVDIDPQPMIYVPLKRLGVGVERKVTLTNYGIDFNLGGQAAIGPGATFGQLANAAAKGVAWIDSNVRKVRVEIWVDNVKYDPLIWLKVGYPDAEHPKPEGWDVYWERSDTGFESQIGDSGLIQIPGDERVLATLVFEIPEEGGFLPFYVQANLIDPLDEGPDVATTPLYAILADGPGLLDEKVYWSIILPGQATAINFTATEYPVGTPISLEYLELGAMFSGASGGPAFTNADDGTTVLTGVSGDYYGPITVYFTYAPVVGVTVTAGYLNEVGSTTLTAYDREGNYLAESSNTTTGVPEIGVMAEGIAYVVIDAEPDEGWALQGIFWSR